MQGRISSKGVAVLAVVFVSLLLNRAQEEKPNHRVQERRDAKTRFEHIEDRARFEFNRLRDPRTGKVPRGIRQAEFAFANRLPTREQMSDNPNNLNVYTTLGPTNLGGRTRAFGFDKRNANIRLAGGVSTGMFRTTNGGVSWTDVTPSGEIHNVTCLAQDPRSSFEDTWYYGTGEALGNSASLAAFYYGNGIYKSTDNGASWSLLANTASGGLEDFDNPFDFVHRIAVDPTNGYVYAAVQRAVYRSTNGGTAWAPVLGEFAGTTSSGVTDVVVTSTGRLYAAFAGTAGSTTAGGLPPSTPLDGVWTSTSGAAGTWTKIAGSGSATTPPGWRAANAYGRVVLAVAPSNNDVLYILYDNMTESNCSGTPAPEADFFKWTQSLTSGVNRSANLPDEPGCNNGNDPFAVQGGYDLSIAVKPNDENFVVIGGTNAYRSTDGFATTANTTRIGGYDNPNSAQPYPDHHPDIHALVFNPSNSAMLVCGSDGGIHEADVTATPVVWTSLNNSYVTYQYYYVTLSPDAGSTNFLGGLQDNGTAYSTGATSHTEVFSGDGASVGISTGNVYHYVSAQNGVIFRRNSTDPPHAGTDIKPTGSGAGVFVTIFYLNPDNTEHLYYVSGKKLYRTTSASTVGPGTWTLMSAFESTLSDNISVLRTSRGTYAASHKLYVGTADGKVYRLNDPANAPAGTVPIDITGAAFPSGAYVSDISVDPADDTKVLVTFSNYGVASIWYTDDASVASPTWSNVEGNLTLPSVQSCMIVRRTGHPTEYYVGTTVGLYSTTSLTGGSTTWVMEGSTVVKKAVVRSLAYRPIDNRLLVGTHGNGMFQTSIPNPLPVQLGSLSYTLLQNNSVRLDWMTISEINNFGFYVQKRRVGLQEWFELPNSFVPGHGTTNVPQYYSFTDSVPLTASTQYRLKQVDLDGTINFSAPVQVDLPTTVAEVLPRDFGLQQNYPNPFNPATTIAFSLPQQETVTLQVFDVLGRLVTTLIDGKTLSPGTHKVVWNGKDRDNRQATSGVYLYRLRTTSFVATKKMVMAK